MNTVKFCPEKLEEINDKGRLDNDIEQAIKDIAEIYQFRGYKRLEDYLNYCNENSFNKIKALDKLDPAYAMQVALEVSKMEERRSFMDYIKSKLVEMEE